MKIFNLLSVALTTVIAAITIPLIAQTPAPTPPPQRTPAAARRTPAPARQKTAESAQPAERYSPARKESSVPQKRRASSRKSLSYGPTYQPPEFRMQANINNPILYFYPSDKSVIAGKDSFPTLVVLSNPKGETFDSLFFAIKYNPAVFEPLGYEDNIPSEFFKTEPRVNVYKNDGILTYQLELSKPFLTVNGELLNIRWKPMVPQTDSPISFTEFRGKNTGVFLDNANILGDSAIIDDGVIPCHITVLPHNYAEKEEDDWDEYASEWDMFRRDSNKIAGDGSVILALIAPEQRLKRKDVFLVDIYFKNPNAHPIDNIHLDIRFDPEVLRVLDYDDDNWITRDVNIHDGSYHEKFPFDFLLKNKAYNQIGKIVYKKGISKSDLLIQEGVMATIRFYALSEAERTSIRFNVIPERRGDDSTAVLYMGNNVLGTPENPYAGVINARLTILP